MNAAVRKLTDFDIPTYEFAGGSLGGQNLSTCGACGCLVNNDGVFIHTEWHRSIAQVVKDAMQEREQTRATATGTEGEETIIDPSTGQPVRTARTQVPL